MTSKTTRLRVIWLPNGADQGRQLVVDGDADVDDIVVPPGEAAPAGRYLRLSAERSLAVQPNDPIPVFLHEDFRAYDKSWSMRLGSTADEADVADAVYRRVRDLVERELRDGARPIGPTFTMSFTDSQGQDRVRGVCVVVRRVA